MSKQWIFVGLIVAGVAAGATIMTKVGSEVAPVAGRAPPRPISAPSISPPAIRCRLRERVPRQGHPGEHLGHLVRAVPGRDAGHGALYHDSLAPRGFAIAAVSIDEGSPEDVREFGRELESQLRPAAGPQRARSSSCTRRPACPRASCSTAHGVIVKRVIGAHDWNSPANRALVERLLDEPGD